MAVDMARLRIHSAHPGCFHSVTWSILSVVPVHEKPQHLDGGRSSVNIRHHVLPPWSRPPLLSEPWTLRVLRLCWPRPTVLVQSPPQPCSMRLPRSWALPPSTNLSRPPPAWYVCVTVYVFVVYLESVFPCVRMCTRPFSGFPLVCMGFFVGCVPRTDVKTTLSQLHTAWCVYVRICIMHVCVCLSFPRVYCDALCDIACLFRCHGHVACTSEVASTSDVRYVVFVSHVLWAHLLLPWPECRHSLLWKEDVHWFRRV